MTPIARTAAAFLLSASLGSVWAMAAQTQVPGPTPTPGATQVQPATPAAVAAGLREAGYRVTVNTPAAGEAPSLSVIAGDYELDVWFSGCEAGTCARVTASLGWELGTDDPDLTFLNAWNSDAFSQAYAYEDTYYLDSTLTLRGGYTRAALRAWLSDYLSDAAEFEAGLP